MNNRILNESETKLVSAMDGFVAYVYAHFIELYNAILESAGYSHYTDNIAYIDSAFMRLSVHNPRLYNLLLDCFYVLGQVKSDTKLYEHIFASPADKESDNKKVEDNG